MIAFKLIFDCPLCMHLYKSQVEHICEVIFNKTNSNDDLFHIVVHGIFDKVCQYILNHGDRCIDDYYLYMLKIAHSYGKQDDDTNTTNDNNNPTTNTKTDSSYDFDLFLQSIYNQY